LADVVVCALAITATGTSMSVSNLKYLFGPTSIAVIGASNRSTGGVIMRNLLAAGFAGPIMPVNPKYRAVAGVLGYPDVASLPVTPDLAVICTPPECVPGLIEELGRRGTRAAVVISNGLWRRTDAEGRNLQELMLERAKTYQLRILGANSLGVLVPAAGLNASFSHVEALPGKVAFVSQSGALCTAVLDWAHPKGIGFSHFISLGDGSDIDFGDVLDYLASDPNTKAILLYIESIGARRNFMAAARAAARNKPVVAIKAGRQSDAMLARTAAVTHSGALAGPDDVFDAVLRRAGILRVSNIEELFAAVETLGRGRRLSGERLAVLTNGGGAGVMASDELIAGGLEPAELSAATIDALDAVLPEMWSYGNPVDILVDAPGSRYAEALKVLIEAPEIDLILVIHAPTALTCSEEVARTVIKAVGQYGARKLLTSWVGAEAVASARQLFAAAGIPTYETPGRAVNAFMHLVNHARNQEMLMQTPPSLPEAFRPAVREARRVIKAALEGEAMTAPQAKAVLAAYGIPTVETVIAADVEEAGEVASRLGFPVALTIHSPDVARKWDVGGIALNLETAEAVQTAAAGMLKRVQERRPEARIDGFTVQRMEPRINARQLIIGVTTDPLFGPVILFGEGGRAVEVIRDHVVGLPPLNLPLARDLISRTRIWNLLQASDDRPAADLDAICLTLVKVSQLIVDMPEIVELDINPLFADDRRVIAIDAHMRVSHSARRHRLAIRPYPKALEETLVLHDGREVLARPIRPEDEMQHQELFARLSPEDVRMRFFNHVRELKHSHMARFTQIDYDREMAFIAVADGPEGRPETLGVVRTVTDPDNRRAEFAIIVRPDLKGSGLGRLLLEKMIRYCRSRGTHELSGEVLAINQPMLRLARRLGMVVTPVPEEESCLVTLPLNPSQKTVSVRDFAD
jgi:acetyltransferase